MIYGSICSGIEAASVAWHPLGWRPSFFAEIDKFPSAVLAHHYPQVPNLGDFTKICPEHHEAIDLLVGGTPCQSFSIAGLRGGLADVRGNLALEYLRLADRARPRWLVWENVPGVLSSNGGRDFGAILGGMVELGYGVAYRVLDAQFIRVDGFRRAVPQRRRRVIAVGYLGDWRRAAAVLFERASLLGHPAPGRAAREGTAYDVAPGLATSGRGFERAGDTRGQDCLVAFGGNDTSGPIDVATARNAHAGPHGRLDFESETFVAHALRGDGFDASEDGTGRGTPLVAFMPARTFGTDGQVDSRYAERDVCDAIHTGSGTGNKAPVIAFDSKASGRNGFGIGEIAPTLRAMGHSDSHQNASGQIAVAIQERSVCENPDAGPGGIGVRDDGASFTLEARTVPQAVAFDMRGRDGGAQFEGPHDTANIRAASGGSSRPYVAQTWAVVRRLTPTECERLQGFPDSYTDVPWRKKNWTPDGPRYKALGNSMAVNVMRWIGQRIQMVEAMEICRVG